MVKEKVRWLVLYVKSMVGRPRHGLNCVISFVVAALSSNISK